MRYIRTLSAILFFLIFSTISYAAQTRGLQVVAKDHASGKQGIVKLYNKSYAVIIGIDRYQNLPPDKQLKNAVNDAKGVEEVLRKNYQFDKISTLFDGQATRDRILEVLTEEIPAQMGKEDALFVFWAGHGNQEKGEGGDIGYLIPYDGDTNRIRKNLTMAEIRDTISKKIPAKHVFYVMDACYSGLLTMTRSLDSKTRRDLNYLREITKESARQVLTAGEKGQEALDGGPKGHSVFTGRLIEILESASDFITANELQASIKEKVFSDASARNHKQTPGFGALYGLGDFVFIPKERDVLGDLTGASAARQKELEQLKKAEQEANEAKKREQEEIFRKERELAALDKQIADMKGRLGRGATKSGDSIDQMLAMVEQKEEQARKLEELRRQREAEEDKRRQEIERLRLEAKKDRARQISADLAKYQKVASSKYGRDMKDAAWASITSGYTEAKEVRTGDVEGFLMVMGLTRYSGEIVTVEEKRQREELAMAQLRQADEERKAAAKRKRMAERLVRNKEVYLDRRTGLMWATRDNGSDINWQNAKSYCESYNLGGFTDWRMPTMDELATLYDKSLKGHGQSCCEWCGNIRVPSQVHLSCSYVWSSDTRRYGAGYAYFSFGNHGNRPTLAQSGGLRRALPVRSVK